MIEGLENVQNQTFKQVKIKFKINQTSLSNAFQIGYYANLVPTTTFFVIIIIIFKFNLVVPFKCVTLNCFKAQNNNNNLG